MGILAISRLRVDLSEDREGSSIMWNLSGLRYMDNLGVDIIVLRVLSFGIRV